MCIYLLQRQPRGQIVFEEAEDRIKLLFVKHCASLRILKCQVVGDFPLLPPTLGRIRHFMASKAKFSQKHYRN